MSRGLIAALAAVLTALVALAVIEGVYVYPAALAVASALGGLVVLDQTRPRRAVFHDDDPWIASPRHRRICDDIARLERELGIGPRVRVGVGPPRRDGFGPTIYPPPAP